MNCKSSLKIIPNQNPKQHFKLKYELNSHKHFVVGVAISNNNQMLATSGWDFYIGILKFNSRKKLRNFSEPGFCTHLKFSPKHINLINLKYSQSKNRISIIASGGLPYSIYIYDLTHIKTPKCLVGVIKSFKHCITQTIFLNEYQFIPSVMEGQLSIWNLLTQNQIGETITVQTSIFDITLTYSQRFVFCAYDFNYLNILTLNRQSENKAYLKKFLDQKIPVRLCSIQIVQRSRLLFTGHYEKIIIWSLDSIMKQKPKAIRILCGEKEFYCLKPCPIQRLIVGCDGEVTVWDYATAQEIQTIQPECKLHYWFGFRFAMTSAKQLFLGGEDFIVKIFKRV